MAASILESEPFTIDFYTSGKGGDTVFVMPEGGMSAKGAASMDFSSISSIRGFAERMGGVAVEIKGIKGIRPIKPGTEEALEYGAASVLSPFMERIEAWNYAGLDPIGGTIGGPSQIGISPGGRNIPYMPPQVGVPGGAFGGGVVRTPLADYRGIIDEASLKTIPVKVPVKLKGELPPLYKWIAKYDEQYEKIKEMSQKPEWADYRVRQLWLLDMLYESQKKILDALKMRMRNVPPQMRGRFSASEA
ncbi:MAG: hypothetical protein ACE5JU_08260 [Candidatus Binatia bacterium]